MAHNQLRLTILYAYSFLFFVIVGPCFAQVIPPEQAKAPPMLAVTGSGKIHVAPDRAVIELGAVARAENAADAQQQINGVITEAIKQIKDLDIPEHHIRTIGMLLAPVYPRQKTTIQINQQAVQQKGSDVLRIVGYRANNTLEITIDDMDKVGPVIDAAVAAGINSLDHVSFHLKDDTEARQQALRKAADEARAKANTLADALNVRLASIHQIVEDDVRVHRASGGGGLFSGVSIQPGQLTVSAELTLYYHLADTALPE